MMPSPAWLHRLPHARELWRRNREIRRQVSRGEPAQDGEWTCAEGLRLQMFEEVRAFRHRWPWRWLPGALRAWLFAVFFVSAELESAIEADRAAFEAGQRDAG